MLFTRAEFDINLRPLLLQDPQDRENAVALAVLSCLCEPGDGFAGFLCNYLEPNELVKHLIARSEAAAMAAFLGSQAVTELQDEFGADWERLWGNASQRWLPRLNKSEIIASLAWMVQSAAGSQVKHGMILLGEEGYPDALLDLGHHRPPALWTLGDRGLLLCERSLAIVGTRHASRYGQQVAADMAVTLAQSGVVTVSGGAFGIDCVVHETATSLGAPTIAFMAGGLANLYPKSNLSMLMDVANGGLLVSEVPPTVSPAKFRFLQRNRLIAALGRATVIVEAGETSGAMNTAHHALRLGREVAVVPGPMDSPRSVGCHDLLNHNLGLVRLLARPEEALELAGVSVDTRPSPDGLGSLEKRALDTFGARRMQPWEVQRLAGFTVKETQVALASLEALELIERVGTAYRLARPEQASSTSSAANLTVR